MARKLVQLLLIFALSIQVKAQVVKKDYHAWPIMLTSNKHIVPDSVLVMQFGEKLEFANIPSTLIVPPFQVVHPYASISDRNTGRLLLYTDDAASLGDSLGRKTMGTATSSNSGKNGSIFFYGEGANDTIYLLCSAPSGIWFRKMRYTTKVEVISDAPFSSIHAQNIALIKPANQAPIVAIPVKLDTTDPSQFQRNVRAIDIFQFSNGNWVYKSRKNLPSVTSFGYAFTFSPNAEYLLAGDKVYRFDASTGSLTDEISLAPVFNLRGGFWNTSKLSGTFSSDSRFLYLNHIKSYPYHDSSVLVQFDLNNWDSSLVRNSAIEVFADSFFRNASIFNIRLAPDEKIYCHYSAVKGNDGYLSVIETPRQPGVSCNFNRWAIPILSYAQTQQDSIAKVEFPNISLFGYKAIPVMDLGHDTMLCVGDSLKLDAGQVVHWNTGDTSDILWIKNSGTYIAELEGVYDTILVQFNSKPVVYVGPDTAFCDVVDYLIEPVSNAVSFAWNTGSQTKDLYVDQAGHYILKVSVPPTCHNADTVVVGRVDSPNLRDIDTLQCYLGPLQIGPKLPGLSYQWSTGDTTSSIVVSSSGTYTVQVSNQICKKTQRYRVRIVSEDSCIAQVFFPNSFTPNGDGFNSRFYPMGINFELSRLDIYNRWGEQVFSLDEDTQGWDGNYLGREASEGVYFYSTSYTLFLNGKIERIHSKGVIHLLR